jgi:hypothetical protein
MDTCVVAEVARAAQARLLWLHTVQIDELTTRYLDKGDLRSAQALAATGAEVSERCLRPMERQRK